MELLEFFLHLQNEKYIQEFWMECCLQLGLPEMYIQASQKITRPVNQVNINRMIDRSHFLKSTSWYNNNKIIYTTEFESFESFPISHDFFFVSSCFRVLGKPNSTDLLLNGLIE